MNKKIYTLFKIITFLLFIMISASSCKHTEDKIKNDLQVSMPENYSGISSEIKAYKKWWQTFPFENLDDFIKSALKENLSLKEAKAKLDQIKAISIKTKSPLFPSLNFAGKASKTEISNKTTGDISSNEYNLGLSASYELDIWNKLNSLRDASLLDVKATEKDIESVYMSLTAKIVEFYIRIIGERNIQNKLQEQIELNQNLLHNIEVRFLNSQATIVDYLKQTQVLATAKAQFPLSVQKEETYKNELNLLRGLAPSNSIVIPKSDLKPFPEFPETGIPIDLINNRPDVESAYIQFQAEMKRLYAAKASRFPSLKLDASFLYTAGKIADIFDNWISSIIGNIIAPIIDGNLKKAEVIRLNALTKQKIATYKLVALTALKEVETAIMQERTQKQYLDEIKSQVESSKSGFDASLIRYKNGMIDYPVVAGTLQALQNLEISLIRGEVELWTFRIAIHKALGGSWVKALKDEIK